MKLDKQVHLFSIDTSFFYTEQERLIHNEIQNRKLQKKQKLKPEFDKIKKQYDMINDNLKRNDSYVQFLNVTNELKSLYVKRKSYKNNNADKKKHKDNFLYLKNEEQIKKLLNKKNELKELIETLPFVDYKKTHQYIDYDNNNKEIGKLKNKLLNEFKKNKNLNREFTGEIKPRDIISMFDSSLTRTIGASINEVTEDIMVVRVFYYDIFKNIVTNGYYYKGEKYVLWSASAGQIRTKKCVFIKQSVLEKYYNSIYCGLSLEKINKKRIKIKDGKEVIEQGCNKNKYLAYTSLMATASDKWEDFNIDQAIVVDDFETLVNGDVDYIDYTRQDENGFWTIERKKMEVLIPTMDGCGISLDYTGMCRLPWCKGLLVEMPFVKFIKEAKKSKLYDNKKIGKVKDIYGKEYDIIKDGIRHIFTKSQFKMWKYYDSWDDYKENFKMYNCEACKCNEDAKVFKKSKISYQPLQSLYDLSDEELLNILNETNYDIENIGSERDHILKVIGATEKNDKKTYYQEALLKYPELINDVYTKEILKDVKKSMVNNAKYGRIRVDGTYVFIIPDVYAFCEWLLLHEENPKGLLEDGNVSCKFFNNGEEIDLIRSPHLNFSHCINTNIHNDQTKKWFKSNGIYTSHKSLYSLELMCDWDGDTGLVIRNKTIINSAKRIREKHKIVPLYYHLQKANDDIISNQSLYKGIKDAYSGGNIGEVSNSICKIWNSGKITDKELKAISYLTLWNNAVIDYAKTLWLPNKSDKMEEFLKEYTSKKLPKFFVYIKDKNKEDEQVEKINKSVVNRISNLVSNPRYTFKATNCGEFDYTKLTSYDVDLNTEIAKNIIKKFDNLNQNKKYFKKNDTEDNNDYTTKYIRNEILKLSEDIFYVVNVLVKHKYTVANSINKRTLWDVFGDIILENLKTNIPTNTKLCDLCGKRFEYNVYAKTPMSCCGECKHKKNLEKYERYNKKRQ